MKLFIKTRAGGIITIDVEGSDTVALLKQKILDKEGISPQQQRLVFAGKLLDDDHTIAEYNVQRDINNLHLLVRPTAVPKATSMQVFIRSLNGRKLRLDVSSSDSVEGVKQMIMDREGVPTYQQRLLFGSKKLEDGHTLAEYDVIDQSTLYLVISLRLSVSNIALYKSKSASGAKAV